MNCRVLYKPDGSVAVMHPDPNSRRVTLTALAESAVAEVKNADGNVVTPARAAMEEVVRVLRYKDPLVQAMIPLFKENGGIVVIETDSEVEARFFTKALEDMKIADPDNPGSLKIVPHPLKGLPFEDMPQASLSDRVDRAKWRKDPKGGILIEQTIVTSLELREADIASLKAEGGKAVANPKIVAELTAKLLENNY